MKTKTKYSVTLHIYNDKYAFVEIGEHTSAGCHVHLLILVHKIYLDIKLETLKKVYFTAAIIDLNLTSTEVERSTDSQLWVSHLQNWRDQTFN